MTSEYELDCANCGSPLNRTEVQAESLGVSTQQAVEVAECPDCGSRYFPEKALEELRS